MIKKPLYEFSVADVKIIEEGIVLDEKKPAETAIRAEVKWQQEGTINTNKRLYGKDILQREIDKISPLCKEGRISGGAYHPDGAFLDVPQVSHLWEKVWMNEKGECLGHIKILPTTHGKDAITLIQAGGKIGLSSRGFGTVTHKTDKIDDEVVEYDEVNKDYDMVSPGDLVLSPSVPDAGVRNLIEQKAEEALCSERENQRRKENLEKKEEKKVAIANVEALKKEYPELTKEIEDTAKNTPSEEDIKKEKEAEKEAWKKEVLGEVQPKIDELEKAQGETIDAIREAITNLSEIPGVIPAEVKNEENKEEKKGELQKADEALQKKVDELETKLADIEKEKEDAKKADEEAKKESEAKAEIKKALEEELKKEEHEKYAELIQKSFDEGDLVIEEVEKIDEAVKGAKDKLSNLAVELQKKEIIKDIDEKGIIANPDDGEKKELTEEQIEKKWLGALSTGYNGTLPEYKADVLKLKG